MYVELVFLEKMFRIDADQRVKMLLFNDSYQLIAANSTTINRKETTKHYFCTSFDEFQTLLLVYEISLLNKISTNTINEYFTLSDENKVFSTSR